MPFRPPHLGLVETATVPYPSLASRCVYPSEPGQLLGRHFRILHISCPHILPFPPFHLLSSLTQHEKYYLLVISENVLTLGRRAGPRPHPPVKRGASPTTLLADRVRSAWCSGYRCCTRGREHQAERTPSISSLPFVSERSCYR